MKLSDVKLNGNINLWEKGQQIYKLKMKTKLNIKSQLIYQSYLPSAIVADNVL